SVAHRFNRHYSKACGSRGFVLRFVSARPTRPGVRSRSATALRIQDSAEGAYLNQRSPPNVGFCPYRKSVVMERRRRAEPSPPAFSTPITLHNHEPGSRATLRPRCFRPALEPIEMGSGGVEREPTNVEGVLRTAMSLRLPLRGRPEGGPRYGKS